MALPVFCTEDPEEMRVVVLRYTKRAYNGVDTILPEVAMATATSGQETAIDVLIKFRNKIQYELPELMKKATVKKRRKPRGQT